MYPIYAVVRIDLRANPKIEHITGAATFNSKLIYCNYINDLFSFSHYFFSLFFSLPFATKWSHDYVILLSGAFKCIILIYFACGFQTVGLWDCRLPVCIVVVVVYSSSSSSPMKNNKFMMNWYFVVFLVTFHPGFGISFSWIIICTLNVEYFFHFHLHFSTNKMSYCFDFSRLLLHSTVVDVTSMSFRFPFWIFQWCSS